MPVATTPTQDIAQPSKASTQVSANGADMASAKDQPKGDANDANDADDAAPPSAQPQQPNDAAEPSSSQSKPFQKSSSPALPLHFFLQQEIPIAEAKSLRLLIKKSGGVPESRFGKADYIVVDPRMRVQALQLQRSANLIGQPIPVITIDYLLASSREGRLLDKDEPRYNLDLILAASRPSQGVEGGVFHGRNPYIEDEIGQIVDYFVQKGPAHSQNAASHDLAHLINHTQASIQTFLRDNFAKGMNLRERVLRQRARAVPPAAARSAPLAETRPQPTPSSRSVPAPDSEEEESDNDIEVRVPKTADVSTTAPVAAADTSRRKSAVIRENAASSSKLFRDADEESEPEGGWEYSALRTKSANAPNKQRDAEDASNSDSERDELEQEPSPRRTRAASDDGSEYRGRRDPNSVRTNARTTYSDADKKTLVESLIAYAKAARVSKTEVEGYLKRPGTDFWDDFATRHNRHANGAWQSHYFKNRETYFKMIKAQLDIEEEADSEEDEDEEATASATQPTPSARAIPAATQPKPSAKAVPAREESASATQPRPSARAIPAREENASVSAAAPPISQKRQPPTESASKHSEWEDARVLPTPPPREEEEELEDDDDAEEMLAVEAEIPATPRTLLEKAADETVPSTAAAKPSKDADSLEESDEEDQRPSAAGTVSDPDASEEDFDLSRSGDMGVPLNPEHRSAAFLDLTIDSDEETRVPRLRRQERAASKVSDVSVRSRPLPFPRPLREHPPQANAYLSFQSVGDRSKTDRTREWARSVSSASNEASSPFSGSRNRTIHHVTAAHPSRSRSGPTPYRSSESERRLDRDSTARQRDPVEAAKRRFRRQFAEFCSKYSMNRTQAVEVIRHFQGRIDHADPVIDEWSNDVASRYGSSKEEALEFLKAANGSFEVAESCMMVAARGRGLASSLKRSASTRDFASRYEDDPVLASRTHRKRRRTDYR